MAVRETKAMIAAMQPVLGEGRFVFCAPVGAKLVAACREICIAMVVEGEGPSFVIPVECASDLQIDDALVMARITLNVHSALDGVGLTAAVANALAEQGIACNVIAGFHHDHIFVPEGQADEALRRLENLSASQRS